MRGYKPSLFKRSFHSSLIRRSYEPLEVREKVQDLPRMTGSGPFPDTPKFETLGTPPSLLHVSLPASSVIYTRRGSIIGANGDLNNITSNLTIDQPITKLANSLPVLYQKITSTMPITMILGVKPSSKNHPSYYATIPVSPDYNWIISQRKALLGWTGGLNVEPYSKLRLWGNIEVSTSSNQGQVALVGEGNIFQVEVEKNQSILINPSNVIAYTRMKDDRQRTFVKIPHTNVFNLFELPWLKKYTSDMNIPTWLKKIQSLIQSLTTKLLWRDDIVLKVKGPRTLLIQTNGTHLNEVFEKTELNDIISKKIEQKQQQEEK